MYRILVLSCLIHKVTSANHTGRWLAVYYCLSLGVYMVIFINLCTKTCVSHVLYCLLIQFLVHNWIDESSFLTKCVVNLFQPRIDWGGKNVANYCQHNSTDKNCARMLVRGVLSDRCRITQEQFQYHGIE